MKKFEYTTTPALGTDLNAMGNAGWEMSGSDQTSLHWKRELPGEPDPMLQRMHDVMAKIEEHLGRSQRQQPQPDQPPVSPVKEQEPPSDHPSSIDVEAGRTLKESDEEQANSTTTVPAGSADGRGE
jgi:hypothetical protein